MPSKRLPLAALIVLAAGLTAGCYESSDVTVYEAGHYKGQRDPLLEKDPQQRAETLAQRFEQVQTDR